jgi:hypothetical protein
MATATVLDGIGPGPGPRFSISSMIMTIRKERRNQAVMVTMIPTKVPGD